MTIAVV